MIRELPKLKKMPSLKKLLVVDAGINKAGWQVLKSELGPKVDVVFSVSDYEL